MAEPEPMTVAVKYNCPLNGKTATYMATFEGPVEDVEVVKVENV